MAAPLRRQKPLASPETRSQGMHGNEEAPSAANDSESGEKFQETFLQDYPRFTAHRSDIRALSAFRDKFKLGRYHDLNIFVLAYNEDISAERVFAKDGENKVVFYSTTNAIKRALKERGHEAKKRNLSRHVEGERANIFIMLDPKITATTHFLDQNIVAGGWVLCRLPAANALRARGKYSFKALIDMSSGNPSLSRHDDPNFWKSIQVDSEESFRGASDSAPEGVITYEKAKLKVQEAQRAGVPGMSEDRVFESYTKLVELAEKQNPQALARGITTLSYTVPEKKEVLETSDDARKKSADIVKVIFGINRVLPTKKGEHDEDVVVMKKDEFV